MSSSGTHTIDIVDTQFTATPHSQYFGDYHIQIQGGPGLDPTYLDADPAYILNCYFTIQNTCIVSGVIAFNDPSLLLTDDATAMQMGTSMTLNMAIVGYSFKMNIDNTYITYDEVLCGTLVVEQDLSYSTSSHFSYQPPNTHQIWVDGSQGLPLYERTNTIQLQAYHTDDLAVPIYGTPFYTSPFQFTLKELDCSIRFQVVLPATYTWSINTGFNAQATEEIVESFSTSTPYECTQPDFKASYITGPGTGNTQQTIDATTWISESWDVPSSYEITYSLDFSLLPTSNDWHGRHLVEHHHAQPLYGESSAPDRVFEIIICEIFKPATLFEAGHEGPHGIDNSRNKAALVINMSQYTQTAESECGTIVYTFTVTSDSDATFVGDGGGKITSTDNVVSLDRMDVEASPYPVGTITIKMTIHTVQPDGIVTDIAYEEFFDVIVLDCTHEDLNIHADSAHAPGIELSDPVNPHITAFRIDETATITIDLPNYYEFVSANAKRFCSVPYSWFSCTDPSGDQYEQVEGQIQIDTRLTPIHAYFDTSIISTPSPCATFTYNDSFIEGATPPSVTLQQSDFDVHSDLTLEQFEGVKRDSFLQFLRASII